MDLLKPTMNRRPNGGRSSWNPVYDTPDWEGVMKYRSTGNMSFSNELNNSSSLSLQINTEQRPMLEYQSSNAPKGTDDSLSQDQTESPMVVLTTSEKKNETMSSLNSSRQFADNGYLKNIKVSAKNTDIHHNQGVVNSKKHVLV